MSDRGAVATARAVGERLADDIRRMDLADILKLPELQLPDRGAAVREVRGALQDLPERDLAVLTEAIRGLPRRVASMEPLKVPHDSPIPDRVVDAIPFLERERRGSGLIPAIAVVSIVGFVVMGIVMTMRRAAMRSESMERWGATPDASADTANGGGWAGTTHERGSVTPSDVGSRYPTGGPDLAPDSGETSIAASGKAMSPAGTDDAWTGSDGDGQGA